MQLDHITVCAVVVTYNRYLLLLECLTALLQQTRTLDAIYIVDNHSTDTTASYLEKMGYIDEVSKDYANVEVSCIRSFNLTTFDGKHTTIHIKIHYAYLPENLGGAGGFAYGIEKAIALGYDNVWILDDDGFPHHDALQFLLNKDLPENTVRCSLVVNKDNPNMLSFGLRLGAKSYYDIAKVKNLADAQNVISENAGNFFNSILISRKIVTCLGTPDVRFFIWGDELEYYFRIVRYGFSIRTVCDSIHYHPLNASHNAPGWKYYYMVRNSIILITRYPRYAILPIRSLAKVILTQVWRPGKTSYIMRGIWDGIFHRMGKRVSPK